MKNLKAKLRKNGGFTLIEMLIVVAIIAILIAVSIPLVNGALEKARDATDDANLRSAKAEGTLLLMGVYIVPDSEGDALKNYKAGADLTTGTVFYDIASGKLTTTKPAAYGKCTGNGCSRTATTAQIITIVIDGGEVKPEWVNVA